MLTVYLCLFAGLPLTPPLPLFGFCCPYTDSEHFVIKGYNEVVMLARLSERDKTAVAARLAGALNYDALYTEPHDDGQVGTGVCRKCPVCSLTACQTQQIFLLLSLCRDLDHAGPPTTTLNG
jgi:hypothetical protein